MAEEAPKKDLKIEATPEQLHKLHAKMDADANGKLSLDEIMHFSHETRLLKVAREALGWMHHMDSDKDGKLSLDEIVKSQGEEEGGLDKFKATDRNSDGFLDEKELSQVFHENVHQTAAQKAVEDKDQDKDGLLTIDEFWGKTKRGKKEVQTFEKLDKDGSGKIDEKEMFFWESGHIRSLQAMEGFMKLADNNSDQHVTIEELHAVHGKEEHGTKYHFMEMIQHHEL